MEPRLERVVARGGADAHVCAASPVPAFPRDTRVSASPNTLAPLLPQSNAAAVLPPRQPSRVALPRNVQSLKPSEAQSGSSPASRNTNSGPFSVTPEVADNTLKRLRPPRCSSTAPGLVVPGACLRTGLLRAPVWQSEHESGFPIERHHQVAAGLSYFPHALRRVQTPTRALHRPPCAPARWHR